MEQITADLLKLTDEQLSVLRTAPLNGAPNRILIALALVRSTQRMLSQVSGVHPSNVNAIVNGLNRSIQLETCQRICAAFGPDVKVDDLFPPTSEVEP